MDLLSADDADSLFLMDMEGLMGLTYKIQEAMELAREEESLRAGVPQRDIDLSRRCGIDAMDVRIFREFSGKGFLMVVRCPKTAARAWHGLIPLSLFRSKTRVVRRVL